MEPQPRAASPHPVLRYNPADDRTPFPAGIRPPQRADRSRPAGLCPDAGAQAAAVILPAHLAGKFQADLCVQPEHRHHPAGCRSDRHRHGLAAAHPSRLEKGETREHWLLPTLTVLVTGIALYTLPNTPVWWLGFGLGRCSSWWSPCPNLWRWTQPTARYPLATAILTVLAFVIFLILAAALKAANARLVLVVPALFLAGGLAALRTLHLRLNERWEVAWAAGIGLVAAQLGAALHYLPLTPVQIRAGPAGSALRADRPGCQPGGRQSLPAGIRRADGHACPVLGAGDLVPLNGRQN